MIALTERPDGVVVPVRAQPGARRNAILGERAGALRIAVSAAPEKGKANVAVLEILAEALGCRPSQIQLLGGAHFREKTFLVSGVAREELDRRVAAILAPQPSELPH
jgi:uncharacterized protein (TIGR00251 family)